MRVFKIKDFDKRAKAEGLKDEALMSAMNEVQNGLVDASLGGDLYKKRIAVGSKGKSGGVRSIIAYTSQTDRIFCLFLFPKNKKANVTLYETEQLKLLAKALSSMTDPGFEKTLSAGVLIEVVAADEEHD